MTVPPTVSTPVPASKQASGSRFRLIFLAPAFALIALLCWALASPIGSSPDDDFHLASIWCAQGDRPGVCETSADPTERLVPSAIKDAATCYRGQPTVSAVCQTSSTALVPTDRGDFRGDYPPLYYATMSVLVFPDVATSVLIMRLLNVLILVGITTALYALLPNRRRSTLLWAWLITTVPLGLFLIASNNPSSWAIIGIGSAWLALLGYFESRGRRKGALSGIFVLSGLLAAGSRGDSAIYLLVSIGVVLVLTVRRDRAYWLSACLPFAMAVVGIIFYATSAQSGVAITGLNDGPRELVQTNPFAVLLSNLVNVPSLWVGAFGTWPLGWLDTTMPAIVTAGGAACFVAVAFSGFASRSRRKTIVVVGLGLLLWLLPTFVLLRSMNLVGTQVQPRYLLPLIIVFAGAALLTVGRRRLVFNRLQSLLIVAALAAAQGAALYYNMRRYITGTSAKSWNLNSGIQWWWNIPVPPMAIWISGSLAFAVLVVILVRENAKAPTPSVPTGDADSARDPHRRRPAALR
ncbi:DUF2142 domain-containing protein [Leifsonia poae]|uniref:DUF2142 domain-containing protein n=1 Tax=Leifsonia poae TaxID=110933 RepID=UPI001CBF1EFB|nr:DUF2142 domain-containing protein [Leifsonia poae]